MNQAFDAWSFRQGCYLPISHHSPKYKTETLIFNWDRKEGKMQHIQGKHFFFINSSNVLVDFH